MGLQGGLGAGVEAGGGFLGNLMRGAAGSLGGTLQAGQMQHEEERQSIRDAAEQRRDDEARQRWAATFGLQREEMDLQKQREARLSSAAPEDEPDYGVLPPDIVGPEAPGQVRAPVGLPRGGYKTFAETLGREKAQAMFPGGHQPNVREQKITDWLKANPGKTRSDYVRDVEFGRKDRKTKGRRQAYSASGKPLTDEKGNPLWLQYESESETGYDEGDPLEGFYK